MRIAIVDDDPIVCQSLETILTATGTAEVLWTANDGDTAVRRYFETPASRPDVLLIDIQMPGTSGLDAARDILATDPAARILFLTTFTDQSYIAQAMGLGAKGYLIKQDVAAVGPALQAVMAGQVVLGAEVLGAEVLGKLTERTPDPADSDDSGDTADSIEGLLGEREREITALVAEGLDNRDIAARLFLSEGTVRNRISVILDKLGLTNRTQLAILWLNAHRRGAFGQVGLSPSSLRDATSNAIQDSLQLTSYSLVVTHPCLKTPPAFSSRLGSSEGGYEKPTSAVFHDDTVDGVGHALAVVGALFEVTVHVMPGEHLQRIGAGGVQRAHRLDEQVVGVRFDRVDGEHQFAQRLGMPESRQFVDQLADAFRGAHHHIRHLDRIVAHVDHIVVVHAVEYAFDAVGHIVEHVAKLVDVLAVERRDERGHQFVHHVVAHLVRRLLNRVHAVHAFAQLVRIEVVHDLGQQLRGLACVVRAAAESVEVEHVFLSRHDGWIPF